MSQPDVAYEVQDVVDDLGRQLSQTAVRAALAEAKLKKALEHSDELQQQLDQAMMTLTELKPAEQSVVIEHDDPTPNVERKRR